MVLEATILVADNSEWMRNGDYTPSRLEAQSDAVSFLFNAKTQTNPENTVGLVTMAGDSPTVMVTLTNDVGKILTAIHNIHIKGISDVNTSVLIAQVHRNNI
jgi:26S proteasome regulatory subunit N10